MVQWVTDGAVWDSIVRSGLTGDDVDLADSVVMMQLVCYKIPYRCLTNDKTCLYKLYAMVLEQ